MMELLLEEVARNLSLMGCAEPSDAVHTRLHLIGQAETDR